MRASWRVRSAFALATAVALVVSTGVATAGADDGVFVEGTESMPTPPPDPDLAVLRARNAQEPTSNAVNTAAVTTHVVYAIIAGDEEWRSYYGSAWGTTAEARMNTADAWMANDFGVDFRKYGSGYYGWESDPDTTRPICGTGGLLSELVTDRPRFGTADVVLGFTNNAVTGPAGCMVGNHAIVKLHGNSATEREYNVWTVLQHEMSHFYGAPDRYPDPNNQHSNDVMENQYNWPNWWCSQSGYNDRGIVKSHAAKYD